MKKYTPKRLLNDAIIATLESLSAEWSSKNVENCSDIGIEEGGALCTAFENCRQCPLHQYSSKNPEYECGQTFANVSISLTRANTRAMRNELKNILTWLEGQ